jgi:hypothetical protein
LTCESAASATSGSRGVWPTAHAPWERTGGERGGAEGSEPRWRGHGAPRGKDNALEAKLSCLPRATQPPDPLAAAPAGPRTMPYATQIATNRKIVLEAST